MERFYNALKQRDKTGELVRLEELEEDYKQFMDLKEKFNTVLPKWTMEEKVLHFFLQRIWHKPFYGSGSEAKNEQLGEERKRERLKEQRIIKDLVAESTWKEQIIRTTGSQKRSLFAWLKAVQRIGKGKGKYANIYRKDASKEMMMAKGPFHYGLCRYSVLLKTLK